MTPVVLLTFHKAQQGVDAAFGTYVSAGIFFLVSFFFFVRTEHPISHMLRCFVAMLIMVHGDKKSG